MTKITEHEFFVKLDPSPPTPKKTEELAVNLLAVIRAEPINDVVQALTSVLGSVISETSGGIERSVTSIEQISLGLLRIAYAMHGAPVRRKN